METEELIKEGMPLEEAHSVLDELATLEWLKESWADPLHEDYYPLSVLYSGLLCHTRTEELSEEVTALMNDAVVVWAIQQLGILGADFVKCLSVFDELPTDCDLRLKVPDIIAIYSWGNKPEWSLLLETQGENVLIEMSQELAEELMPEELTSSEEGN